MASLKDFNAQAGEKVIVKGTVARTALLEPQDTGGNFPQKKRFVRITNAEIVDASQGPALAQFIQSHISQDDVHWFTATTSLQRVPVVDPSGAPITLEGELGRDVPVQLAINTFMPKNFNNLGSGLQAVLIEDPSKIVYAGSGNTNAAALFNLSDVQPAQVGTTPVNPTPQAQSTPQQAPVAQPTQPVQEPQQPQAPANPFASAAPAQGNSAPTNNPFANAMNNNPFAK